MLKILEIPLNEETLGAAFELTPLPLGGFASSEPASFGALDGSLPPTIDQMGLNFLSNHLRGDTGCGREHLCCGALESCRVSKMVLR